MLIYFTLEIFDNVADLAFTKTLVTLSSSIPPAAPDIELYVVIQILLMIETFIDGARATHFILWTGRCRYFLSRQYSYDKYSILVLIKLSVGGSLQEHHFVFAKMIHLGIQRQLGSVLTTV